MSWSSCLGVLYHTHPWPGPWSSGTMTRRRWLAFFEGCASTVPFGVQSWRSRRLSCFKPAGAASTASEHVCWGRWQISEALVLAGGLQVLSGQIVQGQH